MALRDAYCEQIALKFEMHQARRKSCGSCILVDCLNDCCWIDVGWLDMWLAGRLDDCLLGQSVGRLVGRSVVCLLACLLACLLGFAIES